MNWGEFGLMGLMCSAVVGLLFFVVKWTLATTKDILSQAAEERKNWQAAIGNVNTALDEHTAQARAFHESVVEAHRMQRAEHEKMIQTLNEISITLGRINGYKV
jgi:uncharacterized coiled-coil DUF342 family protein